MTNGFGSDLNPLRTLFRSELVSNLAILEKKLKNQTLADIKKSFDQCKQAFHTIKGGAQIAQIPLLIELIQVLEDFLNHHPLTEQAFSIILEIMQILKSFSEEDISNWEMLIAKLREKSHAIIQELKKVKLSLISEPHSEDIKEEVALDFIVDPIMFDLFRTEVEAQTAVLNQGLIDYENTEKNIKTLEALMRAAHSIKGAARVIGMDRIVHLAHAIEDCFVAVQKGELILLPEHIDILLHGIDLLTQVKNTPQNRLKNWLDAERDKIEQIVTEINRILKISGQKTIEKEPAKFLEVFPINKSKELTQQDRILRVTAQNLNRLMGLAGESLVESRWLQPFSNSLINVKKTLNELSLLQNRLREVLEEHQFEEKIEHHLVEVQHKINESSQGLTDRLSELDMFILRHSSLSDRLYREVVDIRMRPFADGIEGYPRMVRDLARMLNKKVRLEVIGKSTSVDRDILDKLEAPLSHLIRNAVDHGIEPQDIRVKLGKPPEGTIKIEAMHRAGMLSITVSDDGKGIDLTELRNIIVEKKLVKSSIAASLSDTELLDFLFLPGFTTSANVSEISGRGVGLNVVQNMLQEVSGTVRASANPGKGMSFQLLLPLTLSVIRALIVDISGEPYAFPLPRIDRALYVAKEKVEVVENHQYFKFEGNNIGLVPAAQILDLMENKISKDELSVIVISDPMNSYGIVVDCFLGERELVVLELDHRLGKIANINSGALMEDGSPVLIVDIEDLVRSIDNILSGGHLHKLGYAQEKSGLKKKKRVLVIDDSITVREVECRLLLNKGYDVLSAVNGIDGLNALRMGHFDLVITDVDMPRMNGIELVRLIRNDVKLNKLPVMIVSYKERSEDRLLGLEAGANYYLTKGSFNDESLLNAVVELIGQP